MSSIGQKFSAFNGSDQENVLYGKILTSAFHQVKIRPKSDQNQLAAIVI